MYYVLVYWENWIIDGIGKCRLFYLKDKQKGDEL